MNRSVLQGLVAGMCGLVGAATAVAQPITSAFTYQGVLKQSGTPLSGRVDFGFILWDSLTGGLPVGSQIAIDNVMVTDGQFTVQLEFGPSAFNGDARFLSIAVKPEGVGFFTTLSPRQPLTAAPYASQTRGLFTDANLNVGIGTTTPAARLHVNNGSLNVSNGNLLVDRGTVTTGVTHSMSIGGSRNSNVNDYAQIDFRNYDADNASVDYVGARISSRNDGSSDDGDLRFSVGGNSALTLRMLINSAGNVGIGTSAPTSMLDVAGALEADSFRLNGNGAAAGKFLTSDASGNAAWTASISTQWTTAGSVIHYNDGDVGIGTSSPQARLDVAGVARCDTLEIDAGADVAENYDVAPAVADKLVIHPRPGMVVSIDPNQVGKLRVCDQAHDRRVAGIISGAGDVKPGLILAQPGTLADGTHPIASMGRVWCLADADANGPIEAGDLLTTSATPGHVMRVTDHDRATGATVGKAMSSLKSGRGKVFVLVTLQ